MYMYIFYIPMQSATYMYLSSLLKTKNIQECLYQDWLQLAISWEDFQK